MTYEIVDIPSGNDISWGKFAVLLDEIEGLPQGKCVCLAEKLMPGHTETLRRAARVRGYRLHIRTTPDATYVWKKEATQ